MCFSAIATIAWLPKLANPLFSKKLVRRSFHAHLENVMTILREGLQSDSYFLIVFPVAWGRSSAGRALDWQSRGQGFDPPRLHHSTSYGLRIRGPFCYHGLMAQRLAQGTHNPWVAGSNPAGPTRLPKVRAHNVSDLVSFLSTHVSQAFRVQTSYMGPRPQRRPFESTSPVPASGGALS